MNRVLVSGGRLGQMVWRSIEYSSGFGAFAEALEKHVSPDAAAIMRAPFALHAADELRAHLFQVAAGFREINIQPVVGVVRFPSAEQMVHSYVAGSPLAGHVARVSDAARAALVQQTASALTSALLRVFVPSWLRLFSRRSRLHLAGVNCQSNGACAVTRGVTS